MTSRSRMLAMVLAALPTAAFGQETDEKSSVDTPAESYRKGTGGKPAEAKPAEEAQFGDNAGWLVEQPSDDLGEPLPLGTEEDFARRGYEIIGEGDKVELIVDQEGQIYRDRTYQGIIPGIRDFHGRKRPRTGTRIQWVGFQPMAAVTRLFFKVSNPSAVYEVTKVDRTTVSIFFAGATVPLYNNLRELITKEFGGPVASVRGKRVRGGVVYTIHLKAPVNHLYRFQAPHYVVIDFER